VRETVAPEPIAGACQLGGSMGPRLLGSHLPSQARAVHGSGADGPNHGGQQRKGTPALELPTASLAARRDDALRDVAAAGRLPAAVCPISPGLRARSAAHCRVGETYRQCLGLLEWPTYYVPASCWPVRRASSSAD